MKKKLFHNFKVGLVALAILALFAVSSKGPGDAFAQNAQCGCIDMVLVVDDTGSMGPAINNVKAGLDTIVGSALAGSGGDLRMGVVTFKDWLEVDQPLTANIADVKNAINAIVAPTVQDVGPNGDAGFGEPEASDEAVRYVATGATLDPTGRVLTPKGPLGPFRSGCQKIIALVTDSTPGGFDDFLNEGPPQGYEGYWWDPPFDDVNAQEAANLAASGGIKIAAILLDNGSIITWTHPNGVEPDVMKAYADTTGGTFTTVPADGTGIVTAITKMIEACGTYTPCPAGEFISSINGGVGSIDPGTGDLYIKYDQFPAPNDNSYGVNAIGWPATRGHIFKDLINSDHAGFQLRDPNGTVRLSFDMDYLTASAVTADTPSGYKSLGPFGGDGSVVTGTLTPADLTWDTSLARNLNTLGYCTAGNCTTGGVNLLVDSPPADGTYVISNPAFPEWDFHNTYYVRITKAKLQSIGFLDANGNPVPGWKVEPNPTALHNSPAKPCPSARFIPATGGAAIPADGAATGAFKTLAGPTYTETNPGEVGTGTITISAPQGFVFDTGGTPPTVLSVKIGGGSGNFPVQGSVTAVTATQITYTVAAISANASQLTWQNIRVRPTAGTPLTDGNLLRGGTAAVVGFPTDANLGTLHEIVGAASKLLIYTQPSATATAGAPFAQQPVVAVADQFGTVRNEANCDGVCANPVVTAARLAGSGTLQGTTSMAPADGTVTFTNLSHNVAGTITIQFTSTGVTPSTSNSIAVSTGTASRLAFTTQPGNATAGSVFGSQPVVRTEDQFGNASTVGLASNLTLSLSLTGGTGPLQGTASSNIGTGAGNGTFTNLRIDVSGANKQLTASAAGLTSALSTVFTVNAGPAASLAIQTQPPTTVNAGVTFSPAPAIRIVDTFGNLVTTGSTVVTAARNQGTAALQGTTGVTAVNGVATFANLSYSKAETITIDFTGGTLTGATSNSVTVNPAAASKLTIQTQPSAAATAGAAFAPQPVIRIEDSLGNLRASDNSTVVTVARGAGSGALQGTLTATAVNGVVTFANLSHNLANTITLSFTASGLTGATSGNIVVSPAAFAKLQLLVPGEIAAPGSPSGKTGTSSARTAGTAFSVTVKAVDNFWNIVNTVTDTVGITSSDGNAGLPPNVALVSGTQVLSVTFKTAGSQTLTASDLTDGAKIAGTVPSITVNPGAFVKLQVLAPGEIAAPGTATGKTGTPAAQSAATAFNVTVKAVDANWNPVISSHTVGITTTDPNDTHPGSATLSSGTRTFAVTFKSAGSWTVTATDTSDGTKTANTSPPVTVNAGAFTKLQILLPGETAAPGTGTGKTGTPSARTAGTPFNVTVVAVDANWNTVTTVSDTVGLASSDPNAVLPANAALAGGTQSFSLILNTVGSRTVTAGDLTDGSKTAGTSPSVTVNPGPFVQLQVLVPGETAAPGTGTGKTGIPAAQTAGTSFNVTIRSVDARWNLVSSTHTVGITSSAPSATLPANGALSAGTRTVSVTLKTAGFQTVTAIDITDGTKIANTSPSITVNAGAASKLTIQTQPSPSATAGVPFAQQPVIRVEDSVGNLITADNGRVITAARNAGTGTLQGTVTAATVNGIATFANLSHNVATTITLNFTAGVLTGATSSSIVVGPATATQVVFATLPGGTSRTGSPLATQPVVKSVDQFGNTSAAGLPANFNVALALTGGSGSLLGTTTLDIGSAAGNGTATFTNVESSDAGSGKEITASAAGLTNAVSGLFLVGGVERATGGLAIPSSTAGGAYTTLTGAAYYEAATGNAGTGTIILNAPTGFVFDNGGTAPTVKIVRLGGIGTDSKNINGVASGTSAAITSRSTTQITFTVSIASSSGITCSLTWQNIRVRPTASSPLASGTITKTGSSAMTAVTNSSTSFGQLVSN